MRRKLGGATLLVAGVFIGVWVKSQFDKDGFSIPVGNSLHYGVVSLPEGLCLRRYKLTFDRGFQMTVEDVVLLVIPHLSIVIPLALLSAYLLLSKPDQSNQKKIPEHTANKEGATS